MPGETGLAMSTSGRLVVVKHAGPGPTAERLRREALVLGRAAHPGVVELVDADSDSGGASIATAFVGGGTLRERLDSGADGGSAMRVVATVAATLADLHDRGVSHGRLTADHILVDAEGRAVLCGLAEAALSSDPGGTTPTAAADVAALGGLLHEVAASGAGPYGVELRRLGDRAGAADPAARASMRSLAAALEALSPQSAGGTPRLGDPSAPSAAGGRRLVARPPDRRSPRRRLAATALAGLAAGLLVTISVSVLAGEGGRRSEGAEAGEHASEAAGAGAPAPGDGGVGSVSGTSQSNDVTNPTTTAVAPAQLPRRVWPPPEDAGAERSGATLGRSLGAWRGWRGSTSVDGRRRQPPAGCPMVSAPLAADVDGDDCEEPLEIEGGVVRAQGRRWQVATAGDVVLVGDWDCDGTATPAVVRPGSGQVWTFPRWAGSGEAGEEVVAELAGAVPGAVDAVAVEVPSAGAAGGRRCDGVEVLGTEGTPTLVRPPGR